VADAVLYCDPTAPTGGDPCPCADSPAAPGLPVVRNRYFTGKYMTARDFRDEQEYFLARNRLHLKALHGWGVVCGLEVEEHDADCRARGWVVVKPGIAVDCHGREIILPHATPVLLPTLPPDDHPSGYSAGGGFDAETNQWEPGGPPDGIDFLFGIQYGEECVEPVPVLVDEAGCRSRNTPNRIRERPEFRFRKWNKDGDNCWHPRGPGCATYPPTPGPDYAAGCDTPAHDCAKPHCPCGEHGFVPLARFRIQRTRNPDAPTVARLPATGQPAGEWPKDVSGRRYLFGPLHPHTLTHICRVNWQHGAETKSKKLTAAADFEADAQSKHLGELKESGWRSLTVEFDRPLCGAANQPEDYFSEDAKTAAERLGFYRNFFQVEFESPTEGRLPFARKPWYLLSRDRKRLHYLFHPSTLNQKLDKCDGLVLHVTLNCDFLADEYGRAVDGTHLRGSLGWDPKRRTGDGVEGGVFESWFLLTGL
jgi:hypothetical protein